MQVTHRRMFLTQARIILNLRVISHSVSFFGAATIPKVWNVTELQCPYAGSMTLNFYGMINSTLEVEQVQVYYSGDPTANTRSENPTQQQVS